MPSFERNLLTQRHEMWSQQTRDYLFIYSVHQPAMTSKYNTPSYDINPESLPYLGLNRYRVVTDRQTDLRWLVRT